MFLVFTVVGDCASRFENKYNHSSHTPIKKFTVIGERCSGTNYLTYLTKKNLLNVELTFKYSWKHFFPWLDLPRYKQIERNLNQLDFLGDSDECLFIFIVRNKYDWVRSFYKNPFHLDGVMKHKGLYNFITHEWVPKGSFDQVNPYSGLRFRNIVELRHLKTLNSFEIGKNVKNFMFVRYEDLNEFPEEFINFLAEKFDLEKTTEFVPNHNYKESDMPYVKAKYFKMDEKSYYFLNQKLEKKTDDLLGYKKVSLRHVNQ